MKKVIVFVFMMSLILSTLISCNFFNPISITFGNNFCNVNLLCGACDDKNYVYFIAKDKKIMRISKESGTVTDMGVSTDFLGTLSIVDEYLYLNSAEYSGDECFITPCKINLDKTKEITCFDYKTTSVSSVGDPVIIIDDTIYFNGGFQKINKDGTGGTAIDDHQYRVIGVENNAIYAYIIADEETEKIIENGLHQQMKWLYKLSSNWKIEQKLFQFCFESQYPHGDGSFTGLVIFSVTFGEYMYSIMPSIGDPDNFVGFCDFQLYRNKLSKNSEKEILHDFGNNYARILAVTEDGIYFYTEEANTHNISNIHRVNHDGTNMEELPYKYDVYNFDTNGYYFVSNVDEKLYGIIDNKIFLIQ